MMITTEDGVRSAFANPHLVPLPAQPGPGYWLRSRVARFSSGEDHHRRRAIVTSEITALEARLRSTVDKPHNPLAWVCLTYAVPIDLVNTVADAYLDPSAADPDAAITKLAALLGPGDDETIANRLGLLVQTAIGFRPRRLITKRLATADTTLEGRPIPAGTIIELDLDAAGLPFGAPPRECPGRALASLLKDLKEAHDDLVP